MAREQLFEIMRNDLFVMAEYGDDEEALWEELSAADDTILAEYSEVYKEVQ